MFNLDEIAPPPQFAANGAQEFPAGLAAAMEIDGAAIADQVEAETRRVIEVAREHKGTRYYDYFQNKQQGYAI